MAVRLGIDLLVGQEFTALRGQRVGLITNHTGLDTYGMATADLLHAAPGVEMAALFGPEHGIRGAVDEHVPDGTDEATGLPVYSLYGARTRPTPEQLTALDTLVFDIQDVGARFYTYISTLLTSMEAAAEQGLRFVVLDRPNPLGGLVTEGPLADADRLDFIACHPIPIRHGLTVGEMARLFAAEKGLDLDLEIVEIEGWRRADWWDATELTWINPSPNMRSLTQALLYPGIGLLEFTNVSVGRGTDTPFEVVGAPWIAERELAAHLNAQEMPGVRFVPIRFTPTFRVHEGTPCGGINLIVTQRDRFVPVETGLAVASALHTLYPAAWEEARYDRLLVNRAAFASFRNGASPAELVASWQTDLAQFAARSAPHRLYL
jgi:uncharacterized protein YbbC (DUF1343 family)